MILTINRLFRGKASIRDYYVKEAKEKKKSLLIHCLDRGEMMTIPYADLDKGIEDKVVHMSKFENKKYKLIDFVWKKDQPEDNQLTLM